MKDVVTNDQTEGKFLVITSGMLSGQIIHSCKELNIRKQASIKNVLIFTLNVETYKHWKETEPDFVCCITD